VKLWKRRNTLSFMNLSFEESVLINGVASDLRIEFSLPQPALPLFVGIVEINRVSEAF
jgi:hypothetical protein